jgi:hypothetical protein
MKKVGTAIGIAPYFFSKRRSKRSVARERLPLPHSMAGWAAQAEISA